MTHNKKPPSLGKMLSTMSRRYHQHMIEIVRPLGLNMTGLAVVMGLHAEPGLSLNEFSKNRHINKALLSKTVQTMYANGFIHIKPDAGHKQRFQLFLTKKSEKLVAKLRQALNGYQQLALENLTAREKKVFLSLLEKIYE